MRWSIRYRLFVPLVLMLLGVVGISTWSARAAAHQAEERIARQVRGVTQTLAGASIALTPRILEQMKGLSGADYLFIDAEGGRIATFSRTDVLLPSELVAQPLDEEHANPLGLPIEIDERHYRGRRLAPRSGGNLFIFYPETSLNDAIRDAVRPSIVFGVFGGLTAIFLMYLIGQRLVGRIRDLERRTRQIAAGDFSPMPLPRQQDELRELSQSVNEMAERLAKFQESAQRTERLRLHGQLSSGLAHQLRNAVTGARLAVQLHVGECSKPEAEELSVALRQLDLIEANLRRFMELGREDLRPRAKCSITAIIDDVAALLEPQCRHAGIELQRTRAHAEIVGDADSLRDLFLNVLGNAIEAAGPGGRVEVREISSTLMCKIEFIDTGSGPPAAIAARLFEPFVTGKPEGIGLGLAVAKQAAEAHGGRIEWERRDGKTVFRILLPSRSPGLTAKPPRNAPG